MKQARDPSVPFILVVLLLDTLGIGVIIPVLPRLVETFVHGDVTQASRLYGGFVSVYAIMQVSAAPIIGALSDRFGRRAVILISLLGAALDYLLLAFAPSLWWLFVGRVLAGITGASFSAATAYIADITPPEKRAQSFGMVGAAFGIGFILGPALGGLIGGIHLRGPFLLAAALNALNFIYGLFVLPESLSKENRRPFSLARANPFGAMKNLGRSPILLGLTGTLVCAYLAQQILQSVWALHTETRFNWSPFYVGLSLACVGVSSAIVQGWLVRLVVPKLGEKRTLLVGLMFNIAGYVAIGFANKGWLLFALLFPFALGGIAGPSTQALLTSEVGPTEQGELQGTLASLNSLCAVFGPVLGTGLFAQFAPVTASPRIPGMAFFAAAALNTIGLILAARLFATMKSPPKLASLSRC